MILTPTTNNVKDKNVFIFCNAKVRVAIIWCFGMLFLSYRCETWASGNTVSEASLFVDYDPQDESCIRSREQSSLRKRMEAERGGGCYTYV